MNMKWSFVPTRDDLDAEKHSFVGIRVEYPGSGGGVSIIASGAPVYGRYLYDDIERVYGYGAEQKGPEGVGFVRLICERGKNDDGTPFVCFKVGAITSPPPVGVRCFIVRAETSLELYPEYLSAEGGYCLDMFCLPDVPFNGCSYAWFDDFGGKDAILAIAKALSLNKAGE